MDPINSPYWYIQNTDYSKKVWGNRQEMSPLPHTQALNITYLDWFPPAPPTHTHTPAPPQHLGSPSQAKGKDVILTKIEKLNMPCQQCCHGICKMLWFSCLYLSDHQTILQISHLRMALVLKNTHTFRTHAIDPVVQKYCKISELMFTI